MRRIALLAVLLLLLGNARAQAGVIVDGLQQPSRIVVSTEVLIEFIDETPTEPLQIKETHLPAGLAGTSINASFGGFGPAAYLPRCLPQLHEVSERLSVANRTLPIDPDLDGLIKPPQA